MAWFRNGGSVFLVMYKIFKMKKLLIKSIGVMLSIIGVTLSGYAISNKCDSYYCLSIWSLGLTIFLFGAMLFYKY